MSKQKHTAIYARVSTTDQTLASQLPELEEWDAHQPEPCLWFTDKFTGTTTIRPGWQALMKRIDKGDINKVCVWRSDRLGRSARDMTALYAEFIERGITLISLREGFDLFSPAGRLMANILASCAQYERELQRERILAGVAVAKAAGKYKGGTLKKGYRLWDKTAILSLRKSHSVQEIAEIMGAGVSTIWKYLAEEKARERKIYDEEQQKNSHHPQNGQATQGELEELPGL